MNVLHYQHNFENVLILRSDLIVDLGAYAGCKLNFRRHVDFLSPPPPLHAMKFLGSVRKIIFPLLYYGPLVDAPFVFGKIEAWPCHSSGG
jgi:hypothetical protein